MFVWVRILISLNIQLPWHYVVLTGIFLYICSFAPDIIISSLVTSVYYLKNLLSYIWLHNHINVLLHPCPRGVKGPWMYSPGTPPGYPPNTTTPSNPVRVRTGSVAAVVEVELNSPPGFIWKWQGCLVMMLRLTLSLNHLIFIIFGILENTNGV